eukprot:CAMPEP_0170566264 /NCGR_PEP_ID=MMETSP0211-20121228/79719_1 /TAXON_ID=311385 /ORGANISM="Pseudokeronopsis sp., Strain OXSARD2" /LENGTH=103 /DNA_ID=CAMNT_0010887371 /DNA_START=254 /DNA_END=565 /DNA_ORIENTATION=+
MDISISQYEHDVVDLHVKVGLDVLEEGCEEHIEFGGASQINLIYSVFVGGENVLEAQDPGVRLPIQVEAVAGLVAPKEPRLPPEPKHRKLLLESIGLKDSADR